MLHIRQSPIDMSWTSFYEHSYTPYSGTPKACVVESKSGRFFTGTRIENISFPLTIPAVQAACSICLSEGEIPQKIHVEHRQFDHLNFWENEFNLEVIETAVPPSGHPENLIQKKETDFNSLSRLKSLLKKAVTINSDFPVSALLFTNDGFFEGVNVEVSDWSKGICAERVAIAKAFASGYTEFNKLEIHTKKGEVSSPCGACRQVIAEHLPYHTISLHHADGTLSEHLSVDLLPFSFKSASLKK
jgi:homotetrameric cytidine deaminase